MSPLEHSTLEKLQAAARAAADLAYSPYSRFRVGAAVLAGGRIYTGANIENASYGLTVCAERTALFQAVLAGHTKIDGVAVACIDAPDAANPGSLMPCGACRQVLAEFCEPSTPIHVARVGTLTMAELLPNPFNLRKNVSHRPTANATGD